MKSKMTAIGLWIMALITLIGVDGAHALKSPHNADRSVSCVDCHVSGWQTRFKSRRPPCLDCHNPLYNGIDTAKKRSLTYESAANIFGTFTNVNNKVQTSHVWSVPEINSNAGVTKARSVKRNIRYTSGINCTNCHYAHGSSDQAMFPQAFLRQDKRGDGICLTCHNARQVGAGSARTYPPASGKYYSHPVEVNYSSIRAAKGNDFYWDTPQLGAGYSQSAVLKLYTAFNFDSYGNAASVKAQNAVICSTCHGPLHSADSNPYTFDSLTGYSMGHYSGSSGDGYLLRRYNSKKSNDLCKACHKVETHQTATKCSDCHEPHKKAGDTNIYLIKKVIATPYGNHSVFFTSTTQMAKRYGIYSGSVGSFTQRSNAICQVCHRLKQYHRAYSTVGAKRDHQYDAGTGTYKNCVGCHPHNNPSGGFKLGGEAACGACHKAPPLDSAGGGNHFKHIGADGGSNYDWTNGDLVDERNPGRYGFSCGRCHAKWVPYTSSAGYPNHRPSATFDDNVVKGYTTEIGFGIKAGQPLPTNTASGVAYNFGARGPSDDGAVAGGSRFSTPGTGATDGQCKNLYCHGQFFNGYTANNPTWKGANLCGSCHGATAGDPPGKTAGTYWGAHVRHLGNANNQQYGSGAPNFRCNACHNATASFNSATTLNRTYHVNGRTNVRFAPSYGDAASRYGVLNDYSASTNINVAWAGRTQYKSCQFIYCHSDGSRMSNFSAPFDLGNKQFPNWSSTRNYTTTVSGLKRRCVRCHGNPTFKGLTAAMPAYASRPGKGNSHEKHIRNGFLCNACHSATVNADNKSIADTTKHVNQTYDVNFLSRYDAGGAIYNGDKTCSNIKCHGGRKTAVWGQAGACKDCHLKSTSETASDEGYADSYAWKNMTSSTSVPRIYSSEWTKSGHGRSSGTYPSSGNAAANKGCSFAEGGCHKSSGTQSHQTAVSGNAYRLYTGYGSDRMDYLCEECHKTGGSRSGEATKKVLGHNPTAMGGWGDANWAFLPKCIDCHDPHGDNNRYMIQRFVNFTGSDNYGKIANSNYARQVTFTTVGGGLMNWSSYVKSDFTGICQRCHNTQANMDHFKKNTYDTGHNPTNRCTGCHKHDSGFKGMDCNGCHYFPPTLSGKHFFHVATTVTSSYVAYDVKSTKTKYAYGCGKCHNSLTHYAGTSGNYTTEVVFDAGNSYPRNADGSAQYVFGARSSIDQGADGAGGYSWTSTKGTCQNLYCHGKFSGGKTGNAPTWYGASVCGDCHGASQADAPTGGAHGKHVGTMGYDCRNCHDDTVDAGVNTPNLKNKAVHVDGKTEYKLYTAWSARIGGAARYYNQIFGKATTEVSSPTYGYCQNIYCHSKGTNTTNPYNVASALPNYTAKWGGENLPANPGEKCSYCHGNKTYKGITAAMPNQLGQAHKVHVVDSKLTKCYICHSNVVDSSNTIVSATNHVNQFKNISIIMTYRSGGAVGYNPSGSKTCANVKCHGGRITPAWTATATCKDCHYKSALTVDYEFRNYSVSASVASVWSSVWMDKGHGRSASSYPKSGNSAANRTCTKCHDTNVKHNVASNPFRLYTADPDMLCAACHGTGTQLGKWGTSPLGNTTGIKTHSKANVNDGANQGNAGWNFGQHFGGDQNKVKCVDCHDPHGDRNRYMVAGTHLNYTGSDKYGIPNPLAAKTAQLYSTVGSNTLFTWSSYVKSDFSGICQRCHSQNTADPNMANFSKNQYNTGHNAGTRCVTCHTHKSGFKGGGCYGCHGTQASNGAPPDSPSAWLADKASDPNNVGLHTPHGYNPRNRFINGSLGGVYACGKCHGPQPDGRSEAGHPGGTNTAGMGNLTSQATPISERSKFSYGASNGKTSTGGVIDDTCSNTGCHTPRAYTRTWKKPADCDDCHGFRNTPARDGIGAGAYSVMTSGSHKMHIYSGSTWKYKFACTRCHVNNANNYTTHYTGNVDISITGGTYARGASFKGATSAGNYTTCSNTYCHGEFTNGGPSGNGTAGTPAWGAAAMTCTSCHMGKANEATMPERHPKHVLSTTYKLGCVRCHQRTVTGDTTVYFTYSAHANTRKDTRFDSSGGMDNTGGAFTGTSRQCNNIYCHSDGSDTTAPFTALANFTADWDVTAEGRAGTGKGCSYCHGNKTGNPNGSYAGLTSAMPNGSSQAHKIHVVTNKFSCRDCHGRVVKGYATMSSFNLHINMSKNVDMAAAYGGTYDGGTMKCSNVKCHGLRETPAWNTTGILCQNCHYSNTDPGVTNSEANYKFGNYSRTAANVYTTEWVTTGHGRTSGTYRGSATGGAGLTCRSCHRTAIPHNYSTASGGNFGRLTGIGSGRNINDVCLRCHGTTAPNKAGGGADKKASHHADTYTLKPKCVDCHDPHGDKNAFMAQRFLNWTVPSDSQGRPSVLNADGTASTTRVRQLTFTTAAATAAWGDYVRNTAVVANLGVCQACHRPGTLARFTKLQAAYDSGHNNTERCAANCHKHTDKFVAGESSGGSNCKACHASIYNNMTSRKGARGINSYHHVMQSDSAARPYPNISAYQKGQVKDSSRTCLICHADHNVFSPDKNLRGTGNRAKNLRKDIFTTPTASDANSFARTDFWPAKRNASSRSDGSANYDQTYPSAITGGKGVCISCHKNIQYKNTSEQVNDGSTRAMPFDYEMYTSSSHNFQVISGFNKVGTKAGQERSFRANCVKCHNDTLTKEKQGDSTYKYGLHDSQRPALLNLTGDAAGAIRVQDVCFKCHSQDAKPSYDYYSSVKMSTTSKLIKTAVVAKTSGHPVGENPGAHKTDEFYNATSATTTAGWNRPGYKSGRHVECTDCHNTHGGNASVTRAVGTPNGNRVAGSQIGAWGVKLDFTGVPQGGAPKYIKTKQVTYQYELCLKCHSGYAYYTGYPEIPSGGVDTTGPVHGTTAFDTVVPGIKQTDIAREFNPANAGYHPVIAKGRNQPPHTINTGAGKWNATGGVRKYYAGSSYDTLPTGSAITADIAYQGISGLGWTFVPPFSQKSLLACSDCHQADNTGNAVGQMEGDAVKSGTTPAASWKTGYFDASDVWQQDGSFTASRLGASDREYARVTAAAGYLATDTFEVDVKWSNGNYPSPDGDISKREVVVIGYGTASNSVNRDFDVVVNKGTTALTLSASTIKLGLSNTRVTATITSTDGWQPFDTGGDTTQNNADASEHSVKINKDDTTGDLYINYAGIAITYKAAGDLRGPHGSLQNWLLVDLDKKVLFDANFDGSVIKDAVGGLTKDNPNANLTDTKNFCLNCHRRDVYGEAGETPTYKDMSRIDHPGGNAAHGDATKNVWGIGCMNCHGGRGGGAGKGNSTIARGGIHGIFATRTLFAGNDGRGWATGAGEKKIFPRPLGVRLLYGATMGGTSDSTGVYCYTLATADALGSCTSEAGGWTSETDYAGEKGNALTGTKDINYVYTTW